jgi:hypothetical protein
VERVLGRRTRTARTIIVATASGLLASLIRLPSYAWAYCMASPPEPAYASSRPSGAAYASPLSSGAAPLVPIDLCTGSTVVGEDPIDGRLHGRRVRDIQRKGRRSDGSEARSTTPDAEPTHRPAVPRDAARVRSPGRPRWSSRSPVRPEIWASEWSWGQCVCLVTVGVIGLTDSPRSWKRVSGGGPGG